MAFITGKTVLTAFLDTNIFHTVDVTDTAQNASGSSYKSTWLDFANYTNGKLTAESGVKKVGNKFKLGGDALENIIIDSDTIGARRFYVGNTKGFSDFIFKFDDGAGVSGFIEGGGGALNIDSDIVNIGRVSGTVNIYGALNSIQTTNTEIKDTLITLNKGGTAGSGGLSGFEIEEAAAITGYVKTNSSRDSWMFKAPTSSPFRLDLSGLSASQVGTVQNSSGTFAWLSDIPSLTGYVPYIGATTSVDLGSNYIKSASYYINGDKMFHLGLGGTTNSYIGLVSGDNSTALATNNVGIGYGSLRNANGAYNTGVGIGTLNLLSTGNNCVAIGRDAGSVMTAGDYNTFIGSGCGSTVTTGARNTLNGYVSGLTTGSYNSSLGFSVDFAAVPNCQASIVLGAYSRPTGSNQLVAGSSDVGYGITDVYFGAGSTNPNANLWIGTVSAKGNGLGYVQKLEPVAGVTEKTNGATVNTTDAATTTTLETIAIPNDSRVTIKTVVKYEKIAGSGAGSVRDGGCFELTVNLKNIAGTVTIDGTLQNDYTYNPLGATCTIVASGANALIQVNGVFNDDFTWTSITKKY